MASTAAQTAAKTGETTGETGETTAGTVAAKPTRRTALSRATNLGLSAAGAYFRSKQPIVSCSSTPQGRAPRPPPKHQDQRPRHRQLPLSRALHRPKSYCSADTSRITLLMYR
jgi:hypothetical protein